MHFFIIITNRYTFSNPYSFLYLIPVLSISAVSVDNLSYHQFIANRDQRSLYCFIDHNVFILLARIKYIWARIAANNSSGITRYC